MTGFVVRHVPSGLYRSSAGGAYFGFNAADPAGARIYDAQAEALADVPEGGAAGDYEVRPVEDAS